MRKTSTNISPQISPLEKQNFATFLAGRKAMTQIKMSPSLFKMSPRPDSALPLACVSGPLLSQPHSLEFILQQAPYRGLLTALTV